jgi:hypothetical protein
VDTKNTKSTDITTNLPKASVDALVKLAQRGSFVSQAKLPTSHRLGHLKGNSEAGGSGYYRFCKESG